MTFTEMSTTTPSRKREMNIAGPRAMALITRTDTKIAAPIQKIINAMPKTLSESRCSCQFEGDITHAQ